ncbi:MAG: hypothetical protein ACTHNS_10695 [Marmoricola sp.]
MPLIFTVPLLPGGSPAGVSPVPCPDWPDCPGRVDEWGAGWLVGWDAWCGAWVAAWLCAGWWLPRPLALFAPWLEAARPGPLLEAADGAGCPVGWAVGWVAWAAVACSFACPCPGRRGVGPGSGHGECEQGE